MAKKKKEGRISIILEHKNETFGCYRYQTFKNRRNNFGRLIIKKYSPLTKKHEIFKEIK